MSQGNVLIVGASSGMGRALAELYLKQGWKVGITGRREALLAEVAGAFPGRVWFRAFDVTEDRVEQHLEELAADLGGVDTIVISAGGGAVNESLEPALEQRIVTLNVEAFTRMAIWAFRYLSRQGHGHLAAITSVAGTRGSRQAPAYSAVKAFQIRYLEGLQFMARKQGAKIQVTDIRPGFVRTKTADGPRRFWEADVQRAARLIFLGLAGRRRVVYVTRRWWLIAFVYRWAPRWLLEKF